MTTLLHGLRVLNTRPEAQAASLSQSIRDAGGVSIECPTLSIQSTSEPWFDFFSTNQGANLAVFISPNAVRFCFDALKTKKKLWPESLPVLAIGEATAKALASQGISNVQTPEFPDSEHLLGLIKKQVMPGQSVMLIKGKGGRTHIEEGLKKEGIRVINLPVYQRVLPIGLEEKLAYLWRDDALDIILITSEQSLQHLFALFPAEAHGWLQSKTCLVLSQRLANAAESLGIKNLIISRPERIMNTLIDYSKGLLHGSNN